MTTADVNKTISEMTSESTGINEPAPQTPEELQAYKDSILDPKEAVTYFNPRKSPRDWERERLEDVEAVKKGRAEHAAKVAQSARDTAMAEEQAKRDAAVQKDMTERVLAATATTDPDGTMRDASGNITGKKNADGTITANETNELVNSLRRDSAGVLRYDNGKMAGPRQKPATNATDELQKKLDANTEALLVKLRQDNPNQYSDATLLANWAQRQNAKIQRPQDKTNVGPRVTIVGGGDPSARFQERRRKFIENNPYAVSPSERVAYLGSGTQPQSFEGALRQQEDEEKRRRTAGIEQAKNAERTAYSQKQIQDAKRRDALGLAVDVALDGLQKNGVIKEKNGHRYMMYSVTPGTLSTVNDQWRTNGGKSEYNSIIAYAEIDSNNKIIGEPMIATRNVPDGQTGKGHSMFKKWTLTEVETALNRAHTTLYSDKGDANEKTKSVMNDYGVIGKGKSSTGTSGVEIAKINAASREKVAEMNNETKLNLANLSGDQKKELAEADNILKKYGIDVGLQIAREKNETAENIATQREEGRQSRAVMRDDQAWAKLAVEQDKVDKSFSVQMKKADTYEKRVGLIEQKLKNDYEIARKKVKTVEERLRVDAEYKDRMASVAEGNVDLGWFKAETAADQSQQKIDNAKIDAAEKRKLQIELASINARKTRIEKLGGVVKDSDLKRMSEIQKVLSGGNLTPEKRKELKDSLNGKDTIKPSDNSGDDNAQSTEYPGYTVGKANRAIAAGWKWDDKTRRFYKPEGK